MLSELVARQEGSRAGMQEVFQNKKLLP
jgi:hypothetical protein